MKVWAVTLDVSTLNSTAFETVRVLSLDRNCSEL